MRRLMALGGVMAGSFAQVEDDQREHFFRQTIGRSTTRLPPGPEGPQAVTTKLHRYTRRVIHTDNGDIEFLAPEAWNDWQALQSALGGSFTP